jgi:SRSO17 transposase
MELFMPKDWETDLDRRSKAGVPDNKKQESKTVIALRMIKRLFKPLSKDIECVVFDALYGYKLDFLWQLVRLKIPFVGDVRGKLAVYLSKPTLKIPTQSGKGPKFIKERPTKPSVLIKDYVDSLSKSDFSLLTVRNGTKGVIQAQYHVRNVWVLHEPSNSFMPLYLLVRKDADGKIKYSLGSFNNQKVTILRMAKAQAQRAFVERVFEEGKNIVGMGDYQTRSWTGFHRHAALSSLALLFLMEQKIHLKTTIGKITAYHIQDLVNATINTLCSLDQVIIRLAEQIPRYQRQIENQLKLVT